MAKNSNLQKAKAAKNDEFYTQYSDIDNELKHYKKHFKGKIVFCNCDDPAYSEFWRYFHLNFEHLGLKKLISTHYDKEKPTYKLEYEGGDDNNIDAGKTTPLMQNGDFRSPECIELLKESNIVVTNEPFSLLREYIAQLVEYNKQFLVVANMNAITYKEIFPLLKGNKMWLGYCKPKEFIRPDGSRQKFGNVCWFTNLDIPKRHEELDLYEHYYDEKGYPLPGIEEKYPHYDNYNAINVDKVKEIPKDYVPCWFNCPSANECEWAKNDGLNDDIPALCDSPVNGCIGVPISYMDKHNDCFQIIGMCENLDLYGLKTRLYTAQECRDRYYELFGKEGTYDLNAAGVVNGKKVYQRILIKRKRRPSEWPENLK